MSHSPSAHALHYLLSFFDTLYHAAALSQPDAVLVTADERYFGKAAALGQIVRLRDWPAWFAAR